MTEEYKTSPTLRDQPESSSGALNTLLGIWLIISPFVLAAFDHLGPARVNNVVVGAMVAIVGLVGAESFARSGLSWLNIFLGIWLIISPFVLGFAGHGSSAMWNNIIVGIAVGLLALIRSVAPRAPGFARG